MHAVGILRNQVFDDTPVEKSGDKHVREGWIGNVNQLVDGSIVWF